MNKNLLKASLCVYLLLGISTYTQYEENASKGLLKPSEGQLKDINCLAHNIWNEAKGEGYTGMKLVGEVTMNRYRHTLYPPTVCDVVRQQVNSNWQFSWMNDSSKRYYMKNYLRYKDMQEAFDIAEGLYYNQLSTELDHDVIYFKVCKVKNKFFNKLQKVKQHQNHCFYREK